MKKLALLVCLLVATMAAQAQFEKGKWILNPSISGLGLSLIHIWNCFVVVVARFTVLEEVVGVFSHTTGNRIHRIQCASTEFSLSLIHI